MTRYIFLALALAGAVLGPFGATSAAGAASGPTLTVEPATAAAGATVSVVGARIDAAGGPSLVLAGQGMLLELGPVRTDATGAFTIEVQIPGHAPAGVYVVRMGSGSAPAAQVTVERPDGGPRPARLSATGSLQGIDWDATEIVVIGLVTTAAAGWIAWRAQRLEQVLRRAGR